ncbi:MAG: hypothetical protein A7315_10970 [Candidatus Altiarchaeales archaeon WOR_SM1_79]|nr:MAG: hypothetical protein A7315_10970 [Candidatus Altiarchaeales archaeon WOR_SM1_79]
MKSKGKIAFAMVLFVVAAFILTLKILTPSPVNIYIQGSETEKIDTGLDSFSLADVVVMLTAMAVICISAMYLLFFDSVDANTLRGENAGDAILNDRRKRWQEISKTLKNDEQMIYEMVINSDGIIEQSEIVEMTGFSKSNVSRILDLLESRGLVERKRRGMGNIVLLR